MLVPEVEFGVCVYLLCSLCDFAAELVQSVLHILSVRVCPLAQRQGTHTLSSLFTRRCSLWWTQVLTLTLQRGAGL